MINRFWAKPKMIYHWTFNLIVKRKSIERTGGGGANKIVVLWWDRTRILPTWNKEEKIKTHGRNRTSNLCICRPGRCQLSYCVLLETFCNFSYLLVYIWPNNTRQIFGLYCNFFFLNVSSAHVVIILDCNWEGTVGRFYSLHYFLYYP